MYLQYNIKTTENYANWENIVVFSNLTLKNNILKTILKTSQTKTSVFKICIYFHKLHHKVYKNKNEVF